MVEVSELNTGIVYLWELANEPLARRSRPHYADTQRHAICPIDIHTATLLSACHYLASGDPMPPELSENLLDIALAGSKSSDDDHIKATVLYAESARRTDYRRARDFARRLSGHFLFKRWARHLIGANHHE